MSRLDDDVDAFFGDLKRKFGLSEEGPDDDTPSAPIDEARDLAEESRTITAPPTLGDIDAVEIDDDHYPGSTRTRRSQSPQASEEPEEAPVWDRRPRVYTVKGKDMEFFPISALAVALRRKAVTMRKWETNGYLPRARFRSPGQDKKQDRLYTRSQIEGLVAIADEEGLLEDPSKKLRIDQTNFPERAHRLFKALDKKMERS